jgi:hypothetical protein
MIDVVGALYLTKGPNRVDSPRKWYHGAVPDGGYV